jgi:3-hydroxyacyl-[acyl-carrier-protein] dehydratase
MKFLNDMFLTDSQPTGNDLPEVADGKTVKVTLNKEHTIYKAHFPGNPITPGVCIIELVGELLGERLGCRLMLSRIANLKFVSPISPLKTPEVEVSFATVTATDTECKAKGTITAAGEVKTKFSLIFDRK